LKETRKKKETSIDDVFKDLFKSVSVKGGDSNQELVKNASNCPPIDLKT